MTHQIPPKPPANVTGEPSDEGADEELLHVAESRRALADTFAWTVPALATAAEAFVLTIALAPTTTPLGRIAAVVAGSLTLIGALHFINKQSYNFDLYDALIERQRERLGRMSLHREAILDLDDLPEWTALQKRNRWTFTVHQGAVRIWRVVLVALIALNVFIGGYALIFEWAGDDPGLLSGRSGEGHGDRHFHRHDNEDREHS